MGRANCQERVTTRFALPVQSVTLPARSATRGLKSWGQLDAPFSDSSHACQSHRFMGNGTVWVCLRSGTEPTWDRQAGTDSGEPAGRDRDDRRLRHRLPRAEPDAGPEGPDGQGLLQDGPGRDAVGHQRQQRLDRLRHLARGARHHGELVLRRGRGRRNTWRVPNICAPRRSSSAPPKRGVKSALADGQEEDGGPAVTRHGASRSRPRRRRPTWLQPLRHGAADLQPRDQLLALGGAVDLLKNRPDLRVLYVHTTDYPMHTWPPTPPSRRSTSPRLDALLGQAVAAAPDAAFLITADHGLNAKTRCWDLAKACKNRGLELRFALSAERDKYVKHHRTLRRHRLGLAQVAADADQADGDPPRARGRRGGDDPGGGRPDVST